MGDPIHRDEVVARQVCVKLRVAEAGFSRAGVGRVSAQPRHLRPSHAATTVARNEGVRGSNPRVGFSTHYAGSSISQMWQRGCGRRRRRLHNSFYRLSSVRGRQRQSNGGLTIRTRRWFHT